MITIKSATARNFLSIGNVTQSVNLSKGDVTLVIGENIDTSGHGVEGTGNSNASGKTALLNAICYAFYGQALTNIKRDNLINKINAKNMLVSVTFEKDGIEYHIERGRKPNLLTFSINGKKQEATDESQGDSRETQKAIENVLGMSVDMFKHIVALNTYTEPFLSMKTADQREIIEQLLGITILSEKAEKLKDKIKDNKEKISKLHTYIEAVKASNSRVERSISALMDKQRQWQQQHEHSIFTLNANIEKMMGIDIEREIIAHQQLAEYNSRFKDIDALTKQLTRSKIQKDAETGRLNGLVSDLERLNQQKCNTCGQHLQTDQHAILLERQHTEIERQQKRLDDVELDISDLTDALQELGQLGAKPITIYQTIDAAYNHKNRILAYESERNNKLNELDPYVDQISELQSTALEEVDWSEINELNRIKEHQEYLLKLLTNKDSFIRKKIIDQNLTYLNQRLTYYLGRTGLPHSVKFLSDLNVEITQLGQDLDFDNLSRGERNRLILSLSWAFRDVWESLYQSINLLFIDELMDSGMDGSGVESCLHVLKYISRERHKNVFLISHREELTSRVSGILKVTKEKGFTTYSTDIEPTTNED